MAARSAMITSWGRASGIRLIGEPGPAALGTDGDLLVRLATTTRSVEVFRVEIGAVAGWVGEILVDGELGGCHCVAVGPSGIAVGGDGPVPFVVSREDPFIPLQRLGPSQLECIRAIVWADDHTMIAGGSGDATLAIWAAGETSPVTISEVGPVESLSVSGALLAVGCVDGSVHLVDLVRQVVIWTQESPDTTAPASAIALDPTATILAVGDRSARVRVWRLHEPSSPEPIGDDLATFASWVNSLDFSPDGTSLAAASSDGTVAVWATSDWSLQPLRRRHPSVVVSVRFLTDEVVASCCEDGMIRVAPMGDHRPRAVGVEYPPCR